MARVSVDTTVTTHDLSYLLPALKKYVSRIQKGINIYRVGGRRTSGNYTLSFTALHLWDHTYIQSKAFHKPHNILPACTIHATPKSGPDWEFDCYDSVLVNKNSSKVWPQSGLDGMSKFNHILE